MYSSIKVSWVLHWLSLWCPCHVCMKAWASCQYNARYVKFGVAHAPGMSSPPPRVSDPDMHHGTCVTHVQWCMPGLLTSGFRWSQWLGKRSWHSRHMRNPQFYVSGKRPIEIELWCNYSVGASDVCCRGDLSVNIKGYWLHGNICRCVYKLFYHSDTYMCLVIALGKCIKPLRKPTWLLQYDWLKLFEGMQLQIFDRLLLMKRVDKMLL